MLYKLVFACFSIVVASAVSAEGLKPYPEEKLGRCGVFVFGDESTLAYVSQASDPKGILTFYREGGEKVSLGLTSHKIDAKDSSKLQNGDKMTLVYGKPSNEVAAGFKAAIRGSLREVCNGSEKSCGGIFAILDGEMAIESPGGIQKHSIEALNGCISLK